MERITQTILEEVVRAQAEDSFDSHAVIRLLYTNFEHEHLDELNRSAGARYPFTETHRQIGVALSRLTTLVRPDGRVASANIRLEETPNQRWLRL